MKVPAAAAAAEAAAAWRSCHFPRVRGLPRVVLEAYQSSWGKNAEKGFYFHDCHAYVKSL
jgi:hypothetical protein